VVFYTGWGGVWDVRGGGGGGRKGEKSKRRILLSQKAPKYKLKHGRSKSVSNVRLSRRPGGGGARNRGGRY